MTVGTLRSSLALDISNYVASMQQAGRVTDSEAQRMQRVLKSINTQLADMGRYGREAANSPAALEKTAGAMEHVGFASAGAKRELIVLAHELSQGNYSRFGGSLMVLAERTNAAELAFSAMGLAVGAATAVVVAFVAAVVIGHHEQDVFARSIVATGNAAGMTADAFDALARHTQAVTQATIGQSRGTLQELVATGRIYPEVIGIATEASINLQRITGQSADEVAKDFAKMADGVAKWTADYNKHAHFVTAAQFAYIKQLEDQGKTEDAARESLRLLNAHLKAQEANLGSLQQAWKWLGETASETWQAMLNVGKADTTQDKIDKLKKEIDAAEQRLADARHSDVKQAGLGLQTAELERLKTQMELLREQRRNEERAATLRAEAARRDEQAIKKIMETKDKPKEQHDPLESRVTAFRQSELAAQEKVNEALRTDQLKAYEQQRSDAIQQEHELMKILGSLHNKDRLRQAAHEMPFELAVDNAVTDYFRDIGDQTKRAEALVAGAFGRMEDAIVNFAKTGKLSFSDLFAFMAEEYLRNVIRMTAKSLLTDTAGNFLGIGNLFSAATSWLGSFHSHASGLDYVPYDGYPAILHKGERVQTALQARSAAAAEGAGRMVIDSRGQVFNIGQGVSRAEMVAGYRQAHDQAVATMARRLNMAGIRV